MTNYWKVGSRWDGNGDKRASLMRIFRRNTLVFIGQANRLDKFNTIKPEDYLAITDGTIIQAVAKVLDKPEKLHTMIENGLVRFRDTDMIGNVPAKNVFKKCGSGDNQPLGVRVHWVDCDPMKYDRGTFQHIWNRDIRAFVEESYRSGSTAVFDIQSATYTICPSGEEGKKSIINNSNYYTIPIYQREYSWGEDQVNRFVRDIFSNFNLEQEPMFIGTMQLSAPKYVDHNEMEYEVIDGQQRLSTIFCLLKYIYLRYSPHNDLTSLRQDWLETRVNNGKEDELLNSLKAINKLEQIYDAQYSNNRYVENVRIIDRLFDEQLRDDKDRPYDLDVNSFISYLTHKLYFVVIETHSGLSKTIRIFNTINTAGLDLNGDDIFKVRLFEYLKDKHHADDQKFEDISEFYRETKEINEKWREEGHDNDIVSIHEVRTIYKDYLISRHKLSSSSYDMGTDRFYELLFDHLLKVQDHRNEFGPNVDSVNMSLEEIRNVLRIEETWNRHTHSFGKVEDFLNWKMLLMSRYGRFRRIAYIVMLANDAADQIDKADAMIALISRIAYCESIRYSKIVTETSKSIKVIYQTILETSMDKAYELAMTKLNGVCTNIENCIQREIFENGKCHRTWGNLICVLSECLAEIKAKPTIEVDELKHILSAKAYDFEHIHATNDKILTGIQSKYQNSIGNLMLLEYDINRSIGNKVFEEKCKDYVKSVFVTANTIISKEPTWTEDSIKQRLEQETKAISGWIRNYK